MTILGMNSNMRKIAAGAILLTSTLAPFSSSQVSAKPASNFQQNELSLHEGEPLLSEALDELILERKAAEKTDCDLINLGDYEGYRKKNEIADQAFLEELPGKPKVYERYASLQVGAPGGLIQALGDFAHRKNSSLSERELAELNHLRLTDPLTGLKDPRLDNPDLLLKEGWTLREVNGGKMYFKDTTPIQVETYGYGRPTLLYYVKRANGASQKHIVYNDGRRELVTNFNYVDTEGPILRTVDDFESKRDEWGRGTIYNGRILTIKQDRNGDIKRKLLRREPWYPSMYFVSPITTIIDGETNLSLEELQKIRENGFTNPITGINDPRLNEPEKLLNEGWTESVRNIWDWDNVQGHGRLMEVALTKEEGGIKQNYIYNMHVKFNPSENSCCRNYSKDEELGKHILVEHSEKCSTINKHLVTYPNSKKDDYIYLYFWEKDKGKEYYTAWSFTPDAPQQISGK